jgi:S1-C subfamily serine protease
MKAFTTALALVLISVINVDAIAQQELTLNPSKHAPRMAERGQPIKDGSSVVSSVPVGALMPDELPLQRLSSLAQKTFKNVGTKTRSAKDAQIYRTISPSVVLIVTKEGLGSGSLIGTSGEVITNYHVVKGYSTVAVVFKPSVEGQSPTRDEMRVGQVVKYDEVTDLALLKVSDAPAGRSPIRLGDASEIAVGADVHAIGHPTGEAWTYTRGVISQYRLHYQWQSQGEDSKHIADAIQTQTPINPGNSGGPLLSDSGALIGVNSFKAAGEGLNFAVSVDEVRKFLSRPENRVAQKSKEQSGSCTPKELSQFRNKENNATIISYDLFCTGKDTGERVIPDDTTKAIFLRMDRNGDGQADVIFFDLKRRGKWDMSWWDENYSGEWTLVGYHDDGSATPSRFESFAAYQKRVVSR